MQGPLLPVLQTGQGLSHQANPPSMSPMHHYYGQYLIPQGRPYFSPMQVSGSGLAPNLGYSFSPKGSQPLHSHAPQPLVISNPSSSVPSTGYYPVHGSAPMGNASTLTPSVYYSGPQSDRYGRPDSGTVDTTRIPFNPPPIAPSDASRSYRLPSSVPVLSDLLRAPKASRHGAIARFISSKHADGQRKK